VKKLYRLMKTDTDGKPLVGSGAMMLGVRPVDPTHPQKRFDVPATSGSDVVHPGDGGLSCYTDPGAIKLRVKNASLWSIDVADLPQELVATVAGDPHHHIEPNTDVTLDELQQLLADTRDLWEPEDGGTP
jgi:hypothetical protein